MQKLISDRYTIDDIERAMDRVAEAIEANPNGASLLPLYEWFEEQLEARRRRDATLERVRARLRDRRSS